MTHLAYWQSTLLLLAIVLWPCHVAEAQRSLIQREKEEAAPAAARPAQEAQPAIAGENVQPDLQQFMPTLEHVLLVEIHFLRKVCNPDATSLQQIRQAGQAELPAMARHLKSNQNNVNAGGTALRQQLIDKLLATAEKVLPAEQAQRYRKEVEARTEARLQAAAEMSTVYLDKKLALTDEQFQQMPDHLLKNWDKLKTYHIQVYTYEEYAPLPTAGMIDAVLNEQQKQKWSNKGGRETSIHFGWQAELGGGQLGNRKLQEMDDYSQEAKP